MYRMMTLSIAIDVEKITGVLSAEDKAAEIADKINRAMDERNRDDMRDIIFPLHGFGRRITIVETTATTTLVVQSGHRITLSAAEHIAQLLREHVFRKT